MLLDEFKLQNFVRNFNNELREDADEDVLQKILDMNFRSAPVLSINDFELAYSGYHPDLFDKLFNGED